MTNEFARIGQLIFDLNAGKEYDLAEEDNFTFVDEEFRRITLALGMVWHLKELGWSYNLEFHAAEGERLLKMLRLSKDHHDLLNMDQFDKEQLVRAYKMLFHVMTELLKRIDILRHGKGIDLGDVNVN